MISFLKRPAVAGFVAGMALAIFPLAANAQSGLITKAINLPDITLSSGKPLADKPLDLEAGKYYRINIVCDGSDELAIAGADFFRNVWINEVVINDVEVRPLGLDSIEFDDEGTATITFIPIRPGRFELRQPGTKGDTQAIQINVK